MPRPRSQRPPSVAGVTSSASEPRQRAPETAAAAAGLDADADDAALAPISRRFSESTAYGHHSRVFDVAFRPLPSRPLDHGDPCYLASAGEDEVVRVWRRKEKRIDDDDADDDRRSRSTSTSTSSFDQVAALRGHGEPVLRVAWGPPGSRLLASAGGDGAARIWTIEGGIEDDSDDVDDESDAPASPPLLRFREARVLAGHPEEVYACEFTQDSRSVVTASRDGVFLWDLETGKKAEGFGGDGRPPKPSVVDEGESSMPARWAAAHVFSATLSPSAGPSSGLVAAACSDGCLRLWSLRQQGGGSPSPPAASLYPLSAKRVHASSPAAACCWSRDGRRVAVTGSRSGGVSVVDVRKMEVCWRGSVVSASSGSSPAASSAMGACFFETKDGDRREMLAVATGAGRVALFDADAPLSPTLPPSPPSLYLRSRFPAASATRDMLCVAAGPGDGSLACSGDAFLGDGSAEDGRREASDARRSSKWSPISYWEQE